MPLLIEIGFDFLELDAPNMCGIDWLGENAAGKIALLFFPDSQFEVKPSPKEIDIRLHPRIV